MGTELPTKVMLGQTLVLMQMTFLNNVRKGGRLVLSRTSCFFNFVNTSVASSLLGTNIHSGTLLSETFSLRSSTERNQVTHKYNRL
jgi:hypothetical protein